MAHLYEVWMSRGNGMVPGPKFRLLGDARRYIEEHRSEASYAVKGPDGTWAVIAPRPRARWLTGLSLREQ